MCIIQYSGKLQMFTCNNYLLITNKLEFIVERIACLYKLHSTYNVLWNTITTVRVEAGQPWELALGKNENFRK